MTAGFVPDQPSPSPSPGFKPDSQGGFQPEPKVFTPDKPPAPAPKATPSGLYSVNPNVNVVGDYLTRWTNFAGGGIRDAFRPIVDGLANVFHLGIFDFNKGHHYAPNDPHLDGRAMDVDTVDGESVGTALTPNIKSFINKALGQNPNVRVGVPKEIYDQLSAQQKARAFVDAPAHIHVELAALQPGQTESPQGFKQSGPDQFMKDPQKLPPGATTEPPKGAALKPLSQAPLDPSMGVSQGEGGEQFRQYAHSALMQVAGHQDLPFILANALLRDNQNLPSPKTIWEQLQDPRSHVRQAWDLYKANPAAAMDEYGLGSPAQDQYMAQHYPDTAAGKVSSFMLRNPLANLVTTFGGEQVNPMAWAEGAVAGKAFGVAGGLVRGTRLEQEAQTAAKTVGLGSPLRGGYAKDPQTGARVYQPGLSDYDKPGNPEVSQWGKATISMLSEPWRNPAVKLPANKDMLQEIFDELPQAQKDEIVRLKQGLPADPTVPGAQTTSRYKYQAGGPPIAIAGKVKNPDLERRAKLLDADMRAVQGHKERTQILDPKNIYDREQMGKRYFPMGSSYQFGPQYELEEMLKGPEGAAGGPTTEHKSFGDFDEAQTSGMLDPEHDLAVNYDTWRRQSLQRVAFEDQINRLPDSVRREATVADFNNTMGIPPQAHWQPSFPGMERYGQPDEPDKWQKMQNAFADFNSRLVGEGAEPKTSALAKELGWIPQYGDPRRITPAGSPEWVAAINLMPKPGMSPALDRSMIAPGVWSFLRSNKGLQRYISTTGAMLPGQEQTPVGRFVGIFRNMILTNRFFHPAVNIAGSDAAARGIFNLGGPQWEYGGYAANAGRAVALGLGLKPNAFVANAEEYAKWVDRALLAGGEAHFGSPRTSALGGEYVRVITSPAKKWTERMDKAMTKFGDWNREGTFGDKGELAFVTSFFKDAVERGGMSDAQAGQVTRMFMGDYYNFDPKSPWSTFFFFMPWLKTVAKAGIMTMMRRPQYITAPAHAMRNFGMATDPQYYQGPSPTGDFTVPIGGRPYTLPFVYRDVSHILQAMGNIPQGPVAAVQPIAQMLQGRMTPPTKVASDLSYTLAHYFSSDPRGPATDWNMIVTPQAPPQVQFHEAAAYFASHLIPVPLFTYALQDAARRGMDKQDLFEALATAGGLGYFGDEKLDDFTKKQIKKAQNDYKKAYNHYHYDGFGVDYLQSAWDTYTSRLQNLGVIH